MAGRKARGARPSESGLTEDDAMPVRLIRRGERREPYWTMEGEYLSNYLTDLAGTYCQWSAKMHSSLSYINPTTTTGEGNILLGDGSVQQATSLSFRGWLQTAADLGNYGPSSSQSSGAVRLLFP